MKFVNTSLRILVVEDSEADFLLIERHLRERGWTARCRRVDSLAGVKDALAAGTWDAVLCDYQVPQLNFGDCLEILKARAPEVPLILISGVIGEEKAVELLKQGIWDFVLKDNLTRLIPAIENCQREAITNRERKRMDAELKRQQAEQAGLNEQLSRAHRATLNLMQDAVAAKARLEQTNVLMRQEISERQRVMESLRTSEEEFRALAESMPQIVWVTRADGWNIYFNHQWTEYTGMTLGESYGHGWNIPFHPDDRQRAWEAWQHATQHLATYSLECRLRRADGTYRWWLVRGVPQLDAGGQPLKWFGTCTDIHDLKSADDEIRRLNAELEQRVRERTADLEAANRELEAFSYSVSHDLRAPLRAMDGFSRIALTKHLDELSPEAREALQIVRSSSQQMGTLIDELLVFSRLSRQEVRKVKVNPADLVRECLAILRPETEGRRVEITTGDLPACSADPGLIKLVWLNLLSNALKYSRKSDPARIEIGGRRNGETVYFVRDNGVGFKMAYAGKIFGVFQRLHRADEFEGTGVGLATAQRIVNRHGGRIWAEAELNKGATFYFTLPAPKSHE